MAEKLPRHLPRPVAAFARMRGRLARILANAAAVCLAVLFPAAAVGQTATKYGDIKIIVDPEQRGFSNHGYTEYGFTVVNEGARERRVTLTLGGSGDRRMGDYIRSISRTVNVGPKADVRVFLYQPSDPPLPGDGVSVTIDGAKQEPIFLRTARGFGDRHSQLILASGGLNADVLRHMLEPDLGGIPEFDPDIGGPPGFGPGGGWRNREVVGPERGSTPWPESWLGYSRYDGVVVTREALAALKPEARTALFQYVECGGSLTVFGSVQVEKGWKPKRNDRAGYTLYRAGFGECIVADNATLPWPPELSSEIARSWNATGNAWTTNFSPVEANQRFPVVENLAIPARGLFAVLFGFAVVLGPVNFWLLARWKRRIWMLWTVPLISAVTCAAVFGYMVVAEGWSGHLRTEAITVLDQNTQRASTLGWTGFYTPLTPGDGLRFSQDTELTLQWGSNSKELHYRPRGGKSCEIDWSDGQRLTRGWVSARVPVHFRLRKSETTRLRVTVQRGRDGNLTAFNGLGVDIKQLTVADERGLLHAAGPIAAGAKVSLQPTGKSLPGNPPVPRVERDQVSLREVYRGDWLGQARTMRSSPEKYLAPLRYVADVAGGPFVEDGLSKAGDARRSAVVLGILKEIEQ